MKAREHGHDAAWDGTTIGTLIVIFLSATLLAGMLTIGLLSTL